MGETGSDAPSLTLKAKSNSCRLWQQLEAYLEAHFKPLRHITMRIRCLVYALSAAALSASPTTWRRLERANREETMELRTVTGVALVVEHITTSTVIVSVPSPADIADLELAMETVHSDGRVGLSEFVVAIYES
ncbi:hypothetical protein ACHHYP_14689, partial [Achlya hypogyna]